MIGVGIAVINYNRSGPLSNLLDSLLNTTGSKSNIIVADDGSIDDSREVCESKGIPWIGSKNMGIAWNKNRALYYFINHSDCSQIILMENDCLIVNDGWLGLWTDAIQKWGHINCLHPSTIKNINSGLECKEIISGKGTPAEPYLCTKISGICIGSRRDAIDSVGYFDTRFKGYGHEHSEWTLRFRRIGLGFKDAHTDEGAVKCNIMISGGIEGLDIPSSSDKSNIYINRAIMDECKGDAIYRLPWRSEHERQTLLTEIQRAL